MRIHPMTLAASLVLISAAVAAEEGNGAGFRLIIDRLPTAVSSEMTYDDGVSSSTASASGDIGSATRLQALLHIDRRAGSATGAIHSLGVTVSRLEGDGNGIVHEQIGATYQPGIAVPLGAGFGVEFAVPIGLGVARGEVENLSSGERISSTRGVFGEIGAAFRPTWTSGRFTVIADIAYHWQREFLAYDVSDTESLRENNTYHGLSYGIGLGYRL